MTGRLVLLALGLGLGLAGGARADTIYLNARGLAQRDALERQMAPARLFSDASGTYIRCRVTGYRPGDMTLAGNPPPPESRAHLELDAWWRPAPDAPLQWSAQRFELSLVYVARIDHEVDDLFDLRLLVGNRDQLAGEARPSAPIAADGQGARWRARMGIALDPDGALALTRPPTGPEEARVLAEERARDWKDGGILDLRGWVVERLTNPALQLPERPTADDLARMRKQAADALKAQHDPFLPLLIAGRAEDAVRDLLEGAARCARHEALEQRAGWDAAANRPGPDGQELRIQAQVVAAVLCAFAGVQPDRLPPEAAARATKFREFGVAARTAVIQAIEGAAAGEVCADDPPEVVAAWLKHQAQGASGAEEAARAARAVRRMPPLGLAARLPIDPSDVALAALGLLRLDTFRLHRDDGERLVRALVRLGRRLEGPAAALDPRAGDRLRQGRDGARDAITVRAQDALVRLLRPDLESAEGTLVPRLQEAGRRFRKDLEGLLLDADPAVRDFIQEVLTHSGALPPVATRRAIEDLFAAALGEAQDRPSTPEEARRSELRREQRRYAITTLVILGSLANARPDLGHSAEEQSIGREVIARFEAIRDTVAAKTGSRAQLNLVRILDRLPNEATADPSLRGRTRAFLALSRAVALEDATRARDSSAERLRAAVDRGEPPEAVEALTRELQALNARLERLRAQ